MQKHILRHAASFASVVLLVAGCTRAQAAPALEAPVVSPALQEVRRQWLGSNLRTLMLRSGEEIFETRRVDNAGPVRKLPTSPAKLEFSYQYAGQTYPAEAALERTFTNALVIVKNGSIVAEIYRNQTHANTHFASFSMAKSITSVLVGLAIEGGYIRSVDDQITKYLPELKSTGYDGVTIKQALMMRSGVNYDQHVDSQASHGASLIDAMYEEGLVRNNYRIVDFARVLNRAYPPGERFHYASMDTLVLGWILERATKQTISAYMTERLWKPAGMESYGFWMLDGAPDVGREVNAFGFNAIARDYARLGLIMLNGGKSQDRQIIPAAWVRESTFSPVPVPPRAPLGYKYQWWSLPDTNGAYMAHGLAGQFIYIDPSTDTVVVKLSYFPPDNEAADEESIAFLRAISAWQPRRGQTSE